MYWLLMVALPFMSSGNSTMTSSQTTATMLQPTGIVLKQFFRNPREKGAQIYQAIFYFSSDIPLRQGIIGSSGFWKLKPTAGVGNKRNWAIWRA
jgi:hypothetical protein